MRYFKNSFNIKIALSFMALIIGICLFLLNRTLINHIRQETNFRAEQSAEILTHILNENEVLDNILLEQYSKFIESLNFPIIISNEQNEKSQNMHFLFLTFSQFTSAYSFFQCILQLKNINRLTPSKMENLRFASTQSTLHIF